MKRLRNHPSIALWCGNNEILAAWYGWGWKAKEEKANPENAAKIWKSYEDIFLKILPSGEPIRSATLVLGFEPELRTSSVDVLSCYLKAPSFPHILRLRQVDPAGTGFLRRMDRFVGQRAAGVPDDFHLTPRSNLSPPLPFKPEGCRGERKSPCPRPQARLPPHLQDSRIKKKSPAQHAPKAAGASGKPLPSLAGAAPPAPPSRVQRKKGGIPMLNIGIIGCGKIAQVRHLPEYAANPGANITPRCLT